MACVPAPRAGQPPANDTAWRLADDVQPESGESAVHANLLSSGSVDRVGNEMHAAIARSAHAKPSSASRSIWSHCADPLKGGLC